MMPDPLANQIQARFIEKKWTLGLAESCSGGGLASRLVQIPDCSLYLAGSVVAYSNDAKETLLQVPAALLQTYGAVSEEVARAMAEGALGVFKANFSLAVTGIAGPTGATHEKPVGTVCFALGEKGGEAVSTTSHFSGGRSEVIKSSVEFALELLWQHINS